ncbi:MFS transporter [Paenibacillus methanolicus]|uniref:Sugar phosphate permease n=1 Tax=Paenibacillus methanolicus TaxID=582686 RepID=A0A5S5CA98_9BACL|nr:MFS transporter [Paenibacillus methanolicus]TYP75432.1 sugar phosphate permease [Paenibacillus methanolicus]
MGMGRKTERLATNAYYPWIGLAALWVIGFAGALTRFIMAYYQSQIAADLAIGRGFISMAWSTNLLIAALCAPVGGWLIDRFGVRRVMLASALFGLAGTATVYWGEGAALFFIGYGVLSGLGGLGASAAYVLLFGWFDRHKAKAAAILGSASSVGLAVCTPLFVSNVWLTWKLTFLVSAAMSVLLTIPLILFVIRMPERNAGFGSKAGEESVAVRQKAGEDGTRDAAREQRGEHAAAGFSQAGAMKGVAGRGGVSAYLPIAIVAFALFTCGINMGTVEMNLVAIHQGAEVAPSVIALSMTVLGVMEIAGSLAFGVLTDMMNKRLAMALLYGIRVVGFAVLYAHLGWSSVLFALLFGLTYLGAVPGGMLIAGESARRKGSVVGNLMLFHQAGGIVGALLGGLSFDAFGNYQLLIAMDAALCVVAMLGYAYTGGIGRGRAAGAAQRRKAIEGSA